MNKSGTIVVMAILGVACALIISLDTWLSPRVRVRPVTDQALLAAGSAPGQWLLYGRDYSNQRHVPLTQINRGTVTALTPVWKHEPGVLLRRRIRPESTPLVIDDMLIYTDAENLVLAVDARNGQELWRYQHMTGPLALCCGMVNRGVAVLGDKVFLGTLDARLVALDRRTGSVVWSHEVARPSLGYSFTMAPLAADGKILIGAAGGEFGIRGFMDAYDPETGRRVWRFWTIPSPEEGGWWGQWSATTSHGERLPRDLIQEKRDSARYADAWQRGGGGVYSTPAYDPNLGLVIFGTGNPSSTGGVLSPGDNLYTTSVVALDIRTGKLRWFYQMVPHNIWDYDVATPAVLFDVSHGGSSVPVVGQAGKTGWVYILDRRTGKLLLRSDALMPMENIFPAPSARGVRTSPGTWGGANWPPAAYSPETGLLYVMASYVPMMFVMPAGPSSGIFERMDRSLDQGTVSAIDVASGRIKWQHKVPTHLMYSGALTTAGGLVFFGQPNGYLNALDASTGQTLWRFHVAERGELGPPISFEVGGQQRIAITTRQGITAFGLPEKRAEK